MFGKQSGHTTKFIIWTGLVILGIVTQHYKIPLLFDIYFGFAAVFYLAIIRLLGYKEALISIVCINLVNYFLLGDSALIWYSVLEVLIIGALYRWKGRNILTWSVVYGVVIWLPFYFFFLERGTTGAEKVVADLWYFQVLVNALICGLLADILADYLPRVPGLKSAKLKRTPLYFGQMLSQLTLLIAVMPIFFFTVVNGWFEEKQVITTFTDEIESAVARVDERISTMDHTDIQKLKLGSVVEKAHFTEMFVNIANQTPLSIFALDKNGKIIVSSDDSYLSGERFDMFENRYVSKVNQNLYLWLPRQSTSRALEGWLRGYYFSSFPVTNLDLELFILMPLKSEILSLAKTHVFYFKVLIGLFILASCFSFLCTRILTKSLSQLTIATSDLPKRVNKKGDFGWKGSYIYEFDALGQNFVKAAKKLKEIFVEAEAKNEQLMKKTQQLVASEQQLYRLAHYDELTGLQNRNSFNEKVEKLLLTSKEYQQEFALAYIDLDKFKQVNDTFGHNGGDLLLKVISERIQTFVDDHTHIQAYRIGGDEFVITIEDTDRTEVEAYCQKVVEFMREPTIIFEQEVETSASIGVSIYPYDGQDVETILKRADNAMYQTKISGKNGLNFCR
ncbi:GGDEF domain-containing protein [Halalkalibacter urbisdiaboli]|uniref:GGDEF domain-containing protein n=1 Tax=Halalkalibacter urbisdiaboli TaxID=1960589 RepID=UPI000B44701A|nr:GGDEF domain-containing protein [Halalkalibacter urbisdiaboli]